MLPIIKALLGLAGVSAGVITPIAVNKASDLLNKVPVVKGGASKIINVLGSSQTVEGLRKEVAQIKENNKFKETFNSLGKKNCKLIQNPVGLNDQFHAFYGCKGGDGKASFYYLGTRDTTKLEGEKAMKEIETLNYEKLERNSAQLTLKFKDKSQEIRLSIQEQGEGGWAYFKNINLSEKCKIESRQLGGDDLRCTLTDSQNKIFFYNFSVF